VDTIRKQDESGGPAALSRRRFIALVTIGLTGTAAISVATACAPAAAPSPTAAPAAQPTEAAKPAAPAAAPTTPPGGAPATAAPAVSSGAAFGKPEDPSPELWWVRDVQMSGGWTMAAENAAAAAIGQQKSFFEQEGLTPAMKPFVTGTDLPNMMAAGQVKIATGSGSLGISVIAAGVKARVICGHCDIAGNQGMTIRTGSGIEKPADLVGKKIGMTTGASITLGMRRFANEQNVDIDKVSFVNGQPPDLVAAFGKGDIDGYAGWEPWLTNTEKLGGTQWIAGNKRFLNGKEEPAEYLLLHSYVVVMEDYLQKNPNTVAAFLRGLKKGVDFINSNPDKAVDLLVEPMRIQKEDLTKMVGQVKYDMTVDDRLIRGMNDQVDFLLELGKIPRKLEPREYMDVSILEKQYPELVRWRA
jgi:ABC-type nitrate/sulfonate/bicarbonate transport system substrate-binding protein